MTSLLLLPTTGLEEIVGYHGDTVLATFKLGSIPVLTGRPRPSNPVEYRFQRAWRDGLGRLFPAESAEDILRRSI